MTTQIRKKGNNINTLPDDYTVIDIETTGLSSLRNEIIELSAIKIRQNKISEKFNQAYRQFGNSVVIDVLQYIGIEMGRALEG